jgi:hypothetical protein
MRTVSTFSRGALLLLIDDDEDDVPVPPAVDPVVELVEPVLEPDIEELSSVPVISTLWPTCALSFDESASRRYVLPLDDAPERIADDPAPVVPAVVPPVVVAPPAVLPVVLLGDPDEDAFIST